MLRDDNRQQIAFLAGYSSLRDLWCGASDSPSHVENIARRNFARRFASNSRDLRLSY
jgi:hypothetical protein